MGRIEETHPDVVVARMSEEHGILDLSKSSWNPEVGEQVRIEECAPISKNKRWTLVPNA